LDAQSVKLNPTKYFLLTVGRDPGTGTGDYPILRNLPSSGEREGAGDMHALLPCTMLRHLFAKSRTAGQDFLRAIPRHSTGWLLDLSGTLRLCQLLKTSCRSRQPPTEISFTDSVRARESPCELRTAQQCHRSGMVPVILWTRHFSTDVLYGPPYFAVKLGCSRPNPAVSAFAIGLALLFFSLRIGH
jgi:hypothetical protein